MGFDKTEIQRRATEWLTISLFSEGRISSGKAAQMLNMSRIDFLQLLSSRGVAYVNLNEDELDEEFKAVDSLTLENE